MGHNSYLKSENTYAREFLCGQMKLIFTMKYYAIASLISSRLHRRTHYLRTYRNIVANEAERKGRLDYARPSDRSEKGEQYNASLLPGIALDTHQSDCVISSSDELAYASAYIYAFNNKLYGLCGL